MSPGNRQDSTHFAFVHNPSVNAEPVLVSTGKSYPYLGIRHERYPGVSFVLFRHDKINPKRVVVNSVIFDSSLRKSEAARRADNLLRLVEEHARKGGFEEILTSETRFRPQIALRRGYELYGTFNKASGRVVYRYKKKL